MSGVAEPSVPQTIVEENREQLERLAGSDLPIAVDARRALELLDEEAEE